jgi:hypothetical protein
VQPKTVPGISPGQRPPAAPHVQAAQAAARTAVQPCAPKKPAPAKHVPAPSTVQAVKLKTSGGTWEDETFVLKPGIIDKTARGADMKLSFTPEFPVSATKIGLVQTVKTVKNGKLYFLGEKTVAERSLPSGEGVGTSIDQRPQNKSFVYPTSGEDESTDFGENGYHYLDMTDGEIKVKKAWLRDTPHLRKLKVGEEPSSQVFEVTALALAGNQKGRYYGSVKWGWELTKSGVHKLIPLEIVSQGDPSSTFMASARVWNKTLTSEGEQPDQIPVTEEPPKSKCFLTTACVRFRGLPDDCEELTLLRSFRDGFLAGSPEGRSLIQDYYRIAPGLVAVIDERDDAAVVYEGIYGTVAGCVAAIRDGRFDVALDLYTEMVLRLEAEFSVSSLACASPSNRSARP